MSDSPEMSSVDHFVFGTKSETLEQLAAHLRVGRVLPVYYFCVAQWLEQPEHVLNEIDRRFAEPAVVVRSSAQNEDTATHSMAGAFASVLDVPRDNRAALRAAIEQVIGSFATMPNRYHQVLIQPMLNHIQMSGVVMTHDLQQGAPYYIVNYDDESGKTDTITGGTGIQKTVMIYRNADHALIKSSRLRQLLRACQELEGICGHVPLDIEFAVGIAEEVYILQVRRITLSKTWHPVTEKRVAQYLRYIEQFVSQCEAPEAGLYGAVSMLGIMPDWNPAEIIGANPRPLAVSLYRHLITDSTWREARAYMGYHHPPSYPLMVLIADHPYIDVRRSFNSFLPARLAPALAEKLVSAWVDRLRNHSEWHDKVEFEIVPTCMTFSVIDDMTKRYPGLLSTDEMAEFTQSLSTLTLSLITGARKGSLEDGLAQVAACVERQQTRGALAAVSLRDIERRLLDAKEGTFAFAVLARHGFIAESLMRSAVQRGALSFERLACFKRSVTTVTAELARDFTQALADTDKRGAFLARFGHLRPGTYDINSLRYDERNDLFEGQPTEENTSPHDAFEASHAELFALENLLSELDWPLSANTLLSYAHRAIAAREYAKLVFTRDLSDALAMFTEWGAEQGLSRDDLSYLDIATVIDSLTSPLLDEADRVWLEHVYTAKRRYDNSKSLKLGHLMARAADLFVVPLQRSLPTFITDQHISAMPLLLTAQSATALDLDGKVVCIENADPGFDWIFTRSIAGLITQYGGANSHMAIRCAEFGIPAAIGCGEQVFSQLKHGRWVMMNCRESTVRVE